MVNTKNEMKAMFFFFMIFAATIYTVLCWWPELSNAWGYLMQVNWGMFALCSLALIVIGLVVGFAVAPFLDREDVDDTTTN